MPDSPKSWPHQCPVAGCRRRFKRAAKFQQHIQLVHGMPVSDTVQPPKKSPDLTAPRCGTCFCICDPHNSDEGYSHCCNDRIEYPDEYLDDPWFRHQILGEPEPQY